MIVWLASYPRSGSTYFKFLLHHFYDLPTYLEDVTEITDLASSNDEYLPSIPVENLAQSEQIYFIKTYKLPINQSAAIYLVRDGRDALTSYAKFMRDYHSRKTYLSFEEILKQLMLGDDYCRGWSNHVLSWLNRKAPTVVVKFEDLVSSLNPRELLQNTLYELDCQIKSQDGLTSSKFSQIKPSQSNFSGVRKEKISNWMEEVPIEFYDIFWQNHKEAMLKIGYSYESRFLSEEDLSNGKNRWDCQALAEPVTIANSGSLQFIEKDEAIELNSSNLDEQAIILEAQLREQLQELIKKEKVIQELILYKNFSLSYWYFCRIRPYFVDKMTTILSYLLHTYPLFTSRTQSRLSPARTSLATRYSQFLKKYTKYLLKPYHDSQANLKLWQYSAIPIKIPEFYYQTKLTPNSSLPMVSIVTPSYNQSSFIERTIKSVLDQNYPNLEYIIQDGASTDGTVKILENYRSQIDWIESIKDSGQANAINLGFAKSKGEIMAWLNSDDLFLPGALDYVVHYFLNHPEVDAVYGHRILIDENDDEVGRWLLPPHDDRSLQWADYIPQETLFWRRSLWDKVGGQVDESYRFAMDWELLLRFQDFGAKIIRLPRFLGAFRLHQQQKTSASINTIGEQEMKRLRERCHGRPISQMEVELKIRPYWWRSGVLRLLYQLGWLRY